MSWPQDILTTTPAPYQFKLVSDTDECICNIEPLEWKSGTLEMKRDLEVGGVFSTFIVDSLTFVGNGADYLIKLFEAKSVNAKCTLIIYYWKAFDATTPAAGRQYIEFPTRYNINFCFFERVKIGRFYFGVKVKAINSSMQTKLDNRQDIDLNVNNQTSMSLEAIPQHYNIEAVKKLNYPAINVNYTAFFESGVYPHNNNWYGLPHVYHQISFTSIPLPVLDSQFDTETKSVAYITKAKLSAIPEFFEAAFDHEFTIDYYFVFVVTNRYVGLFPWNVQLIQITADGEETVTDIAGFGGEIQFYVIQGSETVTLIAGDKLKFVVQSPGIDSTYMAYILGQSVKITEAVVSSPATITEGLPVYEALERMAQNIFDTQYPIYSDYFGRIGVYYKPGYQYGAENQLTFAHVQSGINQRGVPINDSNAPLALNFKKLFESLRAIYNIGYSFETIEGSTRMRIEQYSYFFDEANEMIFDPPLKDRISKYDIQSQVMPELIPVELKSGYDSFEYLSINGRAEPNTTITRTSIMQTATKWNNISPLRADTKGITDNLSNPIASGGTTDIRGDSNIFIIKTQRDQYNLSWKPEFAENITIVDVTSVFKTDQMNRMFTPTRMLLRHANRITAGMTKPDALASSLRFQSTGKNSSLKTSGDGYDNLEENQDLTILSLAAPIYKAMKYTVLVSFTFADMEILKAYPYRYLKFSDTITGYLLNFKKKNNEDKAEITIIERNITLT